MSHKVCKNCKKNHSPNTDICDSCGGVSFDLVIEKKKEEKPTQPVVNEEVKKEGK